MTMDAAVAERFWAKVEKSDECWRWRASLSHYGYGQFNVGGKCRYAHRIAYESVRGPVDASLDLDHLCRNRWCVNPAHLEPVTRGENVLRGKSRGGREAVAARTHCPKGHAFSDENTARRSNRSGRECRICKAEADRRSYEKRKARA